MAVLGLSFGLTTFVPLIVASGFLLTTASNIFGIALHIYQAEIFPTRMRGTAVGVTYSLSRLTGAALPFAALSILQVYGPVAVFSGSALMLCILCLDVGILGPKSTGQILESVAM